MEYPAKARIWWRESTKEWVLDIKGIINDTYFNSRHTQPPNVNPEDVAGLGTLYDTQIDLAHMVAALLVDARRRQEIEPNAGTEARIAEVVGLLERVRG